MTELQAKLFANKDSDYKEFNDKLMLTGRPSIGVRVPVMRAIAREYREEKALDFVPEYAEEVFVMGFIICGLKTDIEKRIQYLDRWLEYVDSWAMTDCCSYKPKAEERDALFEYNKRLIKSDKPFYIRYGVVNLFNNFIDEDLIGLFRGIKSDDYYVKMAIAWGLSVILAKDYSRGVAALKERVFSPWIHNKAIQKGIESYRVSAEQKAELRSLKIKTER